MFFFFFNFIHSFVFDFHDERVASGYIMIRHIDTNHGFLISNLSISNSPSNYSIWLYAYNEAYKNSVFPNKTNHLPMCCPEKSSDCKHGSVHFNENVPVVRRKISYQGSTAKAGSSEIILNQNTDVEFPRKGLYTVLIANCGNEEVTLNGCGILKKYDGSLDLRVKNFYTISILVIVVSIGMISYNLFMWFTSIPKLMKEHKIMLSLLLLFALNGITSCLFYYKWKSTGNGGSFLMIIDAFIRALSTVSVYMFSIQQLQKPQEKNYYILLIAVLPLLVGCYIENKAIANFSAIESGKWIFGFGKPCIEFIIKILLHFFVCLYSHMNAPGESSSEGRHIFLGFIFAAFTGYFAMSFSLFIWRFNKTLIQTKASEWVPFALHPILMVFLLLANLWYVGEYNPEGWQTLNFVEDRSSIYYVKRPNTVQMENLPAVGANSI